MIRGYSAREIPSFYSPGATVALLKPYYAGRTMWCIGEYIPNIMSGGDVEVKWLQSAWKALFVLVIFGFCLWWGRQVREVFYGTDVWQPRLLLDAG